MSVDFEKVMAKQKKVDEHKEGLSKVVSEVLGYRFFIEQRGLYKGAVWLTKGEPEPWTKHKDPEETKKLYIECTMEEAFKQGFFYHNPQLPWNDADSALLVLRWIRSTGVVVAFGEKTLSQVNARRLVVVEDDEKIAISLMAAKMLTDE